MKLRTESGAKIATTIARQERPADLGGELAVVGQRPDRDDDVRDRVELTKVCSQSGRVSAGTNALDRKVSGNITIRE